MNNKTYVKVFRDLRDIVCGLTDEEWTAVDRDFSYKYTKMDLVVLCSSMVKILSTHVIGSILPTLIDGIGMLPVLHAEIKLKEIYEQGRTTSQSSPKDPSDYACSLIEGVITQIKEAMKQALMKCSSFKTRKTKHAKKNIDPVGESASDSSLIDVVTASYTKSIISEIVQLCCPDISHKITQGRKPDQTLSFHEVIKSLVRVMDHIDVHGRRSTNDALGESNDEKDTSSDGSEESIFSKEIRSKAVHAVSLLLLEAAENITLANGSSFGPLDELTVMPLSVRVRPTASEITKKVLKDLEKQEWSDPTNSDSTKLFFPRNRFLSDTCKTYRCVQKKVYSILRKVEASSSPEEENGPHAQLVESKTQESGSSDASSSELSSEHVSQSMMNVVKGSSSTSVCDKELLSLETCTDEVISKILGIYQKQTSDNFQSTCTQLVSDVLFRNMQMLHTGKKRCKAEKKVSLRKLSNDLIIYLISAASEITQSFSRELEECLKALSGNQTQTGSSGVSNKRALDYENVFAPYRLFTHVRNKIKDVFSTVKEIRQSKRKRSGNNRPHYNSVMEVSIREDGTVVNKFSLDHEGFSQGFAQRQFQNEDSAINQLKSVLSSNTTMQSHALVVTNAISTMLRNTTAISNSWRTFSELVMMDEYSYSRMFGARGISSLVHRFLLEFANHLDHYLSSTDSAFLQMAGQTTAAGKAIYVDLSELTNSLTNIVVESTGMSATPTRGSQNTEALDELNAGNQEDPSVRSSAPEKKKRRRITVHFTCGKKKAGKSKKSKHESCPAGQQEIQSSDELNGNDLLQETAGSFLRKKFGAFCSAMRKLVKSR